MIKKILAWFWESKTRKEAIEKHPAVHNQTSIYVGKSKFKLIGVSGDLIPIDGSLYMRLVDTGKLHAQVSVHLQAKHPEIADKIMVAQRVEYTEVQAVTIHVIDEHFEEIKLEKPIKETVFLINGFITTDACKNTQTGEIIKLNATRYMIGGDTLNVIIGHSEWEAFTE